MSDKTRNQIVLATIRALEHAVPLGEYRLFAASSQLPSDVPWGGPSCQAVVLAASAFGEPKSPGGGPSARPGGTVYLWRAFRADPKPSAHWNIDDALYYTDASANTWRVHSKDSPDHFASLAAGSGLGDLMTIHSLPAASAGSLDQYRHGGARLDFEGPFKP